MSAPSVPIRKSPMREQFDRIAAKFEAEIIPLTRYEVAHLIKLSRDQVEANEPNACGHATRFTVTQVNSGSEAAICLMCEFSRSRHGHADLPRGGHSL